MKYNYQPLKGICEKAIKNNLCKGCTKLENANFAGQVQCNLVQESKQKIKNILGVQEKII